MKSMQYRTGEGAPLPVARHASDASYAAGTFAVIALPDREKNKQFQARMKSMQYRTGEGAPLPGARHASDAP